MITNKNSECKILVVDDDPDLLRIIERLLKEEHYIVSTAVSGQECLQTIRLDKPDLLLLDVMLPDLSGIDICKTIKSDPQLSSIFVVLLSGMKTQSENISEGLETGADGYLIKPLQKREFLARVDAAFRIIRAEKTVRESEERYRHISSTISDISYSCIINQNGSYSIDWMVGAVEQITGYSIEEIKAMQCWGKLVVDEDLDSFNQHVSGLTPGSSSACELRLRHKNGAIIWVASSAECDNGQEHHGHIKLYGALVDITERKHTEKALKKSEMHYHNLFDQANEGLIMLTMDGKVAEVNQSFAEMHGYTVNDLKNMDIRDLDVLRERSLDDRADILKRVHAGEVVRFEVEHYHKDGHIFPLSNTVSLINIDGQEFYMSFHQDISNRKQAEEELQESKKYLDRIINTVASPLFVKDNYHKFCLVNEALCSLLSLPAENIIGTTGYEIFPEDQMKVFIAKDEEVFKTGEENSNEEYITDGTGKIRTINTKKSLYTDTKGNKFLVGVINDITERKMADEALKHSHELMRYIIEHNRSAIAVHDRDLKYVYVSQRYLQDYKVKEQDVIGKHHYEVFPDLPQKWRDVHQKALAGEISSAEEDPYVREDGTVDWTRWECRPWHEADGSIGGIIIYTEVITERMQAEEKIREKDIQFRKLSSNLPDLIFQFTRRPDGTYYVPIASEGIKNIFGCSPEDVVDDFAPIGRVIYPEDSERVISDIEYSANHLTYFTCEFRVQIPGKPIQWIFSRSTPEKLADGSITWYGFNANITEIKQTEFELIKAKERAEAGNRLKTAFMNNISHEIRTPLNGILGFSSLIVQPDISYEEKDQFYSFIKTSSHRLLNTVTSYMDIALIASGTMEVKRNPIDLYQMLLQLRDQFQPLCATKNLELHLEIPGKIKNITLHSDEELLRKILSHILDNAVKFTNQGRITFGYAVKSGSYEFYVNDTGIGISKESLSLIFESFIQEELSSTRGHEGSGLGLSIAQGLVRLLGGEMHLESEKGIGSTFFFTITHEGMKEAFVIPESEKTTVTVPVKPVILIAEDDESNRFYLEKILTTGSVKVLSATDGREAVEQCRAHPEISLVLMDLKMPVMDGFEATREIKTFRKVLPIIALTAFALSGDKKRALEAGCDDYLSKPVSREVLFDKLKKYGLAV